MKHTKPVFPKIIVSKFVCFQKFKFSPVQKFHHQLTLIGVTLYWNSSLKVNKEIEYDNYVIIMMIIIATKVMIIVIMIIIFET